MSLLLKPFESEQILQATQTEAHPAYLQSCTVFTNSSVHLPHWLPVLHIRRSLYYRIIKPQLCWYYICVVTAPIPVDVRLSEKVKRWRVRATNGAFHQEIFERAAGVCGFARYGAVGWKNFKVNEDSKVRFTG